MRLKLRTVKSPDLFSNVPVNFELLSPNLNKKSFLDDNLLASRIFVFMTDCENVDDEALSIISNHTEAIVRKILERMLRLAEHRLENLNLNPLYTQVDDPRVQVKFLQDAKQKMSEKRGLLDLVKEKRKERDEAAALTTNQMALAALDMPVSIKRCSEITTHGKQMGNHPLERHAQRNATLKSHRPKITVLALRDLQYVLGLNPILIRRLYLSTIHRGRG
ncbi:transcription initiation factor TFIID component TAF4 family domain-containing protein [Ditylenchus destructor]|uniref:Transcription initiation factor TFIID component TAF4 family domain-containing protein n=1 Tax=Ditylenchus destructor TaxID=166010 RepID=A0AAD4R354_9BILA|nr:transcription initiation factor TFIID component TAF4 family domain-containing protein [Ditylenchus destructor]